MVRAAIGPLLLLLSGCVIDTPGFCRVDTDCPDPAQFCKLSERECQDGPRQMPQKGCSRHDECRDNQLCLSSACVDALARADLSGAQVVPPTCSLGEATVLFVLSPNNTELTYYLTYQNIPPETVTDVHIHTNQGPPLPVFTLKKESGTLDKITVAADNLTDLARGSYYIDIHTTTVPRGEVRAHISSLLPDQASGPTEFFALLSGLQQKVPVGSPSSGKATVKIDEKSGDINYTLSNNLPMDNPIQGIHIHRGAFNNEGPHIIDVPVEQFMNNMGSPSGTLTRGMLFKDQTGAWASLIKNGLAYVNVHTKKQNGGGELRGQLVPIQSQQYAIPFNTVMDPSQVKPTAPMSTAVGVGQFFLSQDKTRLSWRLSHTAVNATAAFLRFGSRTSAGTATVCTLGNGRTGAQGLCDVKIMGAATNGDLVLKDLMDGNIFAEVRTQANPNGEIRGQLTVPQPP